MENGWQYSKLYSEHADKDGNPTDAWWAWAQKGWDKKRADRYPMGKGRKPLCSYWNSEKLGYIEARKRIYGPLYARAVMQNPAWQKLCWLYKNNEKLYLRDYDAYDHRKRGMTLSDVLNEPKKIMGMHLCLRCYSQTTLH